MKKKITYINAMLVLLYGFGMIFVSLGINMILRSKLGAGAWDTVVYSLSHLVDITLGSAAFAINLVLLLFVIVVNKKPKYLFVLVPIIMISSAIDFWDIIVFKQYSPNSIFMQGFLFIIGAGVLTLGLAMIIVTKFPAMIIEEFTFSIMKVAKVKSFLKTRIGIEFFAIATALILGFWAGIRFGAVDFGSLFLAIVIGPMITFQTHWLTKILTHYKSKKM